MSFEIQVHQDKNGNMIVEGYATTFDQPYKLYENADYVLYEQIDRHAFDKANMNDVIMQFDHEGTVYARTRNKTLFIYLDNHGLKVKAYLGGTANGRKLFEEIKGGYVDRMSFAFKVEKDNRTQSKTIDGRTKIVRTITKISYLYDVSAVSRPANEKTIIAAIDARREKALDTLEKLTKNT